MGRFQVTPSNELPLKTTPTPTPTACPITSAVDQTPPPLPCNPTPHDEPQGWARTLPLPLSTCSDQHTPTGSPQSEHTPTGSPRNQEHITGSSFNQSLLTGYLQNQGSSTTDPPKDEHLLVGSCSDPPTSPPLDPSHLCLETKAHDEDDEEEEGEDDKEQEEEDEEVEEEEEEKEHEHRRRRKRGRRTDVTLNLLGTSVDSGFSANNAPDAEGRGVWEESGYATPLHQLWMSHMRTSAYLSSDESESEVEEVWEELQELREK